METLPSIPFDDFGPERIVVVHDSRTNLRGYVAIDNTAKGPAKGGIRMAGDLTLKEVFLLARAMTWKTALAELQFGGGKAGIVMDPHTSHDVREKVMRAFARRLKGIVPHSYIAAPDIGTSEKDMAVFADELDDMRACTGKPAELGGLPHELGFTGFGVYVATKALFEYLDRKMEDVSFAIEGFGEVGSWLARFLQRDGCRVVAVSDSRGTIYNKDGIDVEKLIEIKQDKGSVVHYPDGKVISNQALFELDVDVLVPGARPNAINDENKNRVKAKYIVEAANIPIPERIEREFHEKGIMVVPDIIANAGGVIASYVEYINGTASMAFSMIKEKISENVKTVLDTSVSSNKSPREVALELAKSRVKKAMEFRSREWV